MVTTNTDFAIEVSALHKSFGKVHALRGIDFTVPRGSVLGMLGPNGAGKTTAVRVLTTLLHPDSGESSSRDMTWFATPQLFGAGSALPARRRRYNSN